MLQALHSTMDIDNLSGKTHEIFCAFNSWSVLFQICQKMFLLNDFTAIYCEIVRAQISDHIVVVLSINQK